MGDIADEHLERLYDGDDDDFDDGPRTVQCKYCKRDGFTWSNANGPWRLMTPTGKQHLCRSLTERFANANTLT